MNKLVGVFILENKIDDTNKHDTTSDNDKNDIDTLNTPDCSAGNGEKK